jgi:hypothetical protein
MDQAHTQADHQGDHQARPQPNRPPDTDDARWVSFAELAKIRGISKDSAIALVRRRGWRRQRDNQGHVIALVPSASLTHEADYQPDDPPESEAHDAIASGVREAIEAVLSTVQTAHAAQIEALQQAHAAGMAAVQAAHAQALGAHQREAEVKLTTALAELHAARADLALERDHSRAANEATIAERERATKAEATADAMKTLGVRETEALQDAHTAEVEALNLANASLIEGLDRRLATVTARANTAEEALEEVRDAEAARRALPLIPRILAAVFRR